MTDSNDLPNDSEGERVTDDAIRTLVRGALGTAEDPPDLTRGVQEKIRVRSRGKFYADGWSTTKHPPVTTYLVTSVLMLVAMGLIYALLHPLSGEPAPARPPEP
ncbi:MAG TPA: hypothetical protein VKY73_24465, partial [Polyangiaceae bacterium]|nr:hypothetical protein [Polyangiaceae bacterium]